MNNETNNAKTDARDVWLGCATQTCLPVKSATHAQCTCLMCSCLSRVLHVSPQPSVPLSGCGGSACSSAVVMVEEISFCSPAETAVTFACAHLQIVDTDLCGIAGQ